MKIKFEAVVDFFIGIYVLWAWCEEQVNAFGIDQSSVGIQVARIGGQVVRVVELGGIDKDADDRYVIVGTAAFNEAQMSFVKGSHGWDKSNALVVLAKRVEFGLEVRDGMNNFHFFVIQKTTQR